MRNPNDLVASWMQGRARISPEGTVELAPRPTANLAAKCRAAYEWLVTKAVVVPYHDVSFGERVSCGLPDNHVELYPASYSSYLLFPLLTLVTSQRLLFVGAPGRGKTTIATLMGLLSSTPLDEMRRAIQHGHPQLTITDLLGSPLPSQLVRAESATDIRVAWRRWLSLRVKIIDEYNRIPTKTQSALLSLMAEGYAEMYEQIIQCGRSAWFLTANDDLGGGTFQVIDALKDRIDIVVRSVPFHTSHLDTLVDRVASGKLPEQVIPADIQFTTEELDQAEQEIRSITVPPEVRDVLGFFAGQLDFCRRASLTLELQSKDTLHLAGRRVAQVCTQDCPLDKHVNLCAQTENGISARALQSILLYAKALAWFRGGAALTLDDVRAVLPWTLFEKLRPNLQSEFFQKEDHELLLHDRASWIRSLFEQAVQQHAAHAPIRAPIEELQRRQALELERLNTSELRKRLDKVRQMIDDTLRTQELNGPVHADLVLLKSVYAGYRNQLAKLAPEKR